MWMALVFLLLGLGLGLVSQHYEDRQVWLIEWHNPDGTITSGRLGAKLSILVQVQALNQMKPASGGEGGYADARRIYGDELEQFQDLYSKCL